MLKRTLFFSNPCRWSVKDKQMLVLMTETGETKTATVEDLGFVVLEHQQISISLPLIDELTKNNVAVVFCDRTYHPASMLLNLNGHHLQQELFSQQIVATAPLKKNLWKQTVEAKIRNQAALLKKLKKDDKKVLWFAGNVKSGDSDNREGAAARAYWPVLFGASFSRERYGDPPNNMLNYAYAVLRAAVARSLAGSGLLATLGIHHHNRYNAFCLADDIMEPYRPFVDGLVYKLAHTFDDISELTTEIKMQLIGILTADVKLGGQTRPLMVALSNTTASLGRCFMGQAKRIVYPGLSG
ncbi:MAG: type II CRISPR-associated endonuclease Cas1 [Bacteroidales bacterium]|nr:type II CRISPR-associated endonuclease Cas1 [Bacteroidales bacterium]